MFIFNHFYKTKYIYFYITIAGKTVTLKSQWIQLPMYTLLMGIVLIVIPWSPNLVVACILSTIGGVFLGLGTVSKYFSMILR